METEFFRHLLNRRTLVTSSLASAAVLKFSGTIHAQDAAAPEAETLLSGLGDPRYMVIDGDSIYFTESGTGGDDAVLSASGGETPLSMTGLTGKLSKYSVSDGSVTEIVSDFRSYTFGENGEIVGPAGVALDGAGNAFVAVGAPGAVMFEMAERFGGESVVYKVNLETGEKTELADLFQFEVDNDPDPALVDSNLYGAAYAEGKVYVVDAGGNDVIAVDPESGETSLFAVTGGLEVPFENPARGGAKEIDSVPSCVVLGPDGRLYVSYVSGGPFPAGAVHVDAYSLDGSNEVVAAGLTMVSDVAFDSAGRMYVCMISTDFIKQAPGQIVRVEDDGSLTIMVDGLVMPMGMEFDAEDNLYLFTFSTVVPGGGNLVRYAGLGQAEGIGTVAPPAAEGDGSADAAAGLAISCKDVFFGPNELHMAADTDVELAVTNDGFLAHDWVLEGQDIKTSTLGNGDEETLTLNLPAGEYVFFCSQVGHRQQGMEGKLIVS